jgi:hypothetical protein
VPRPLAGALAGLALLLCACGGGSDDGGSGGGGGSLSEKRAGELAEQYVVNILGVLTGDVNAQKLIDSFAPECREGVKASDIAAAVGFIALFVPQLADVKIEDVDLGELTFEKTGEGILVLPTDPDGIKIKVKGKFVNANEFFSELGFDDTSSDSGPLSAEDALLIVERDGKAYLGDCSELQDFGGGEDLDFEEPTPASSGSTASRTPSISITLTVPDKTTFTVPGSASTPAANRPGGTRATAVSLGSSVVVEETWKVTVLSVNKDAADVVEANSSFFEEPAADERVVLIKVRVENVSKDDDAQSIAEYEFSMTGSRNELYSSFDEEHSCGFLDDSRRRAIPSGQATATSASAFRATDEPALVYDASSRETLLQAGLTSPRQASRNRRNTGT